MNGDDTTKQTSSDDLGVTFVNSKGKAEKTIDSAQALPTTKISSRAEHTFNVSQAIENEGIETGAIITDKRRRRPSFMELAQSAFSEWWGKTQSDVERVVEKLDSFKKPEPQTVINPNERKEVIVAAAEFTKQAPRDDHHVVIEKIRTLSQDAQRVIGKPYIVKDSPHESAWKNTSEPTVVQSTVAMKNTVTAPVATVTKPASAEQLDLRKTSVAPEIKSRIVGKIDTYIPPEPKTPVSRPAEPVTAPRISARQVDILAKDEHISVAPPVAPQVIQPLRPETMRPPLPQQRYVPVPEKAPVQQPAPQPVIPIPPPPPSTPLPVVPPPSTPSKPTVPVSEKPSRWSLLRNSEAIPKLPEIKPENEIHEPVEREPEPAIVPEQKYETRKTQLEVPSPVVLTRQNVEPQPILTFNAIATIVVIAITLGVGAGVYMVRHSSTAQPGNQSVSTSDIPTLVTVQSQVPFSLPGSRNDLLKELSQRTTGATASMMQYYPTLTSTMGVRPATASEIIFVLAPHADGSFLRGLSNALVMGSVITSKPEPFIVLKSSTFEVAFAGMLSWEPTLQEDLSPLFGSPATGSTSGPFTDALSNNHSIRILYDQSGNERLMYAIVNKNLIVITSSTEALSQVLKNLK